MRYRRYLWPVLVALACLMWPLTVAAQYDTPILSGPGFFPANQARGPFVLIPTLTLAEEYNDNVLLDNNNRKSDWISYASPGVRLLMEGAGHRVSGGYFFTAEKHVEETEFDNVFRTQGAFFEGRWTLNPVWTFTLSDILSVSDFTNVSSAQGISSGRTRSVGNSLSPGATWQLAPRSTLTFLGSYTLQRFETANSQDSNVYRLGATYGYDFTRRFKGTIGYDVTYIDIERQRGTTAQTPRLGFVYQFTPTLTMTANAGPTFISGREDTITASGSATLTQRLSFGSASLSYNRDVAVAGGLGGPTENQVIAGVLRVTTLARGLAVDLAPSYTMSKSVGNEGIDVKSLTVILRAGYQITSWLTGIASYNFFHQRSDTTVTTNGVTVTDVDQNRVFLGLQFGYPIRRD